jgi:hypothetical protein
MTMLIIFKVEYMFKSDVAKEFLLLDTCLSC